MSAPKATVLVVLSTNDELNARWLLHHEHKIPQDVEVIVVENYDALCVRSANLVRYLCLKHDNWRAIIPFEELAQGAKGFHGTALDKALEYVTTPYVFTLDNDFFVERAELFDDMLRAAHEKNAVIVGELLKCAYPYVHPACALYATDVARKYQFRARYIENAEYLKRFYNAVFADTDIARDERKHYLDVGAYIYFEARNNNLPVVDDFPISNYGRHIWGQSPYIWYTAPGEVHRHVRLVLPDGRSVVFNDIWS
ncbi:MAG: hypothetical protein QXT00_02800 [Ignisphaera sp.]